MPRNCEQYLFRTLSPDDADQYRNLRIEALKTSEDILAATLGEVEGESVDSIRADIERRFNNGGFSLGAFSRQSDLVGLVNVGRPTLKRQSHIGILWGLFVNPAHRGQGVARALLQEAILRARASEGLRQLHIEVVTSNMTAFDLYRKLGFEVYGTRPRAIQSEGGFHDEHLLAMILK